MVLYRYNRLDNEVLTGENYGTVSFSYQVDYPAYIKAQIKSHRKVVVP